MHYDNEDANTYTYTIILNKKNWKLKVGADFNTESGWYTTISYMRAVCWLK